MIIYGRISWLVMLAFMMCLMNVCQAIMPIPNCYLYDGDHKGCLTKMRTCVWCLTDKYPDGQCLSFDPCQKDPQGPFDHIKQKCTDGLDYPTHIGKCKGDTDILIIVAILCGVCFIGIMIFIIDCVKKIFCIDAPLASEQSRSHLGEDYDEI